MTKLKAQVGPMGHRLWNLPDSELMILWYPGGRLNLTNNKPLNQNGFITSIDYRGSDGTYKTAKDAQKAVEHFVNGGNG